MKAVLLALAACTASARPADEAAPLPLHRVTADGTLRAVTATPIAVPQIEDLWGALVVAWLAPDGSAVAANDVIVRFDRVTAEKQLRAAQGDLDVEEAVLREDRIKADASAVEHAAALALATRQLAQVRAASSTDPLLFARNEILESTLDEQLAVARRTQAEHALATDRSVSRANLALDLITRDRAQLAVGHARAALANLELRAPHAGVVVIQRDDRGELLKLGTRVWIHQPLAALPVPDRMEAQLFVLELDGNALAVGMRADVVIESHPERVFHGAIREIDRVTKPRDARVPMQYVSVTVALDETDPAICKPGQRVRAVLQGAP